MTKVYYSIDWLQGTTPFIEGAEAMIIDRIQRLFPDVSWTEKGRAQRPYTNVVSCLYASIHWHPEHPEFKYLFRMDGHQLDAFRRDGGDVVRILKYLKQFHFTITRIDLARDIFDRPARPAVLYNKWKMGDLQTAARKVTIVQSATAEGSAGETVYFGGRTSERYLRVYDKGKQANVDRQWTRAEFELKGDNAEIAVQNIFGIGLHRTFHTYLGTMIPRGLPEWMKDDSNEEVVALEAIPRRVTNSERWLWQTVVPAIQKALAADVPGFRDLLEKMIDDPELKHGIPVN